MRSNHDNDDLTSCLWVNLLAFINTNTQAYTLKTPRVTKVAVTTEMGHHGIEMSACDSVASQPSPYLPRFWVLCQKGF